jgi:hypothetical protein
METVGWLSPMHTMALSESMTPDSKFPNRVAKFMQHVIGRRNMGELTCRAWQKGLKDKRKRIKGLEENFRDTVVPDHLT